MRRAAAVMSVLLLLGAVVVLARGDDDDKADPQKDAQQQDVAGPLKLTEAQQQAVGLLVEHPLRLKSAPLIEAYGTVLDPLALVTDAGRLESARAQAAASAADTARLERLYHDDAQASLKSLQAAQAQSVEAAAQARAAQLSFALQWGPLASWSDTERAALLSALAKGQQLLMRADVPGRYAGGALDKAALVELDGVNVTARVLGVLARTEAQSQSSGWLLQLERVPPGFGPGARALVRLRSASASDGLLVPAAALVFAAEGAFVYRQTNSNGAAALQYISVPVKPLTRVGEAWLVAGLNPADQVVVRGAGVLWSLQGISSFSAAEEDHD